MKKLFTLTAMVAMTGTLALTTTGCLFHRHHKSTTTQAEAGIISVSPAMVHASKFQLAWDSPYEHETNIIVNTDGSKIITVSRNTNIVYNIYESSKPTVPMRKWKRIATVDTTNYTATVKNFPVYFTVRTMDVRTHLESAPAR